MKLGNRLSKRSFTFITFSDGWWNSDNCWMKEMNTTANNKSVPPAQEFWRYIMRMTIEIVVHLSSEAERGERDIDWYLAWQKCFARS